MVTRIWPGYCRSSSTLSRDVAGEHEGLFLGHFPRLDHDAQFAPGLEGETFFHAGKRKADAFQVLHPLEVGEDGFGPGAGPGGADGVGRAGQNAEQTGAGRFAVMGGDAVDNRLRLRRSAG